MKAEGAGIKPLGYAATYELTRDFMPQAYGSDPQGIDGGAFIEFRDAPTGNDTNGVPKYRVFPYQSNQTAGANDDNVWNAYTTAWFDNRGFGLAGENMLYLLAANTNNADYGGWCTVASGAAVVFNYGTAERRENVVVHELGHGFGLVESDETGPGPDFSHIDTYTYEPCWDNSNGCVMSYDRTRNSNAKFCIHCLIEGSGVVNGQLRVDSLRTRYDVTGP